MIPDTVPCRCGAPVEIRGGLQWTIETFPVYGTAERVYLWAGGRCRLCGFVVQYGYRGQPHDYQHSRMWFIDKEAECIGGRVRDWPSEWGFEGL